jgi:hypothetical protein
MLSEELYTEINSLQLQIDDLEKNFDIALQNPAQLRYARQLYLNIKVLEERLSELKILLNQNLNPD